MTSPFLCRESACPPVRLTGWALLLSLGLAGCFPHAPGPRLQHFSEVVPAPGEEAPSLELVDLEGKPVMLEDHLGQRPVVLQLGSVSCPVFRYRRFGIEDLVRDLGDRVTFLVVYTREAHPVGSPSPYTGEEWDLWINRLTRVRVADTRSTEERRARAAATGERLDLSPTVLVDPSGDPGWRAFGRAPSAAFVLDPTGRVVARQAWVDPQELRGVLEGLLEGE